MTDFGPGPFDGFDPYGIQFFDAEQILNAVPRPGSPAIFTEHIKRSACERRTLGFRIPQDDAALWRGRLRNRAHALGYGVTVRIEAKDDSGMCDVRFRAYHKQSH